MSILAISAMSPIASNVALKVTSLDAVHSDYPKYMVSQDGKQLDFKKDAWSKVVREKCQYG